MKMSLPLFSMYMRVPMLPNHVSPASSVSNQKGTIQRVREDFGKPVQPLRNTVAPPSPSDRGSARTVASFVDRAGHDIWAPLRSRWDSEVPLSGRTGS